MRTDFEITKDVDGVLIIDLKNDWGVKAVWKIDERKDPLDELLNSMSQTEAEEYKKELSDAIEDVFKREIPELFEGVIHE